MNRIYGAVLIIIGLTCVIVALALVMVKITLLNLFGAVIIGAIGIWCIHRVYMPYLRSVTRELAREAARNRRAARALERPHTVRRIRRHRTTSDNQITVALHDDI